MKHVLLALLLVTSILTFLPANAPASGTAIASIQQTSTATLIQFNQQNFWENTTNAPYGQSTPVSYNFGFTNATASSILSGSLTIAVNAQAGKLPRMNIQQGSNLVMNGTVFYSISLAPLVTATPIVERIVALSNVSGNPVSTGHYFVWLNGTQSVLYQLNSIAVWTGGPSYTISYVLKSPTGYALSQNVVFIPFPSVAVDPTTVTTQLNGTAYANFQVVLGGVYVNVPSVVKNSQATISVSFGTQAKTTGAAPVLNFRYFSVPGNPGLYNFTVAWTNTMTVNYAGQFLLQNQNLPFPIDPNSLNISANGVYLLNGTVVDLGKSLVLLDGSTTVVAGSTVTFVGLFRFVGSPPIASITGGSVLFYYGTLPVTLRPVVFSAALMVPVVLVIAWLSSRKYLLDSNFNYAMLMLFLVLVAIAVALP